MKKITLFINFAPIPLNIAIGINPLVELVDYFLFNQFCVEVDSNSRRFKTNPVFYETCPGRAEA